MLQRSVHQILVGVAKNDAITSMALEIREVLQTEFDSEIYCYHPVDESFPSFIKNIKDFNNSSSDDILIYHLSFGIPELTSFLLSCNQKLVIVYHNVTPSHFYQELLPDFADALEYGRLEISLLKDRAELVVGVSEFNASELRNLGYEKVQVVSSGANPHRLSTVSSDTQLLIELRDHFPDGFLLFVSQVLPHKRVDHAIEVVHLLRTVHRLNVGLVIAGPIRQPAYKYALDELRERLNDALILMTDSVTNEQLAALYRSCLCYIGTSEHEGLSLPPLEAMANRAPVLVRGAGAIPETVCEGGIVLPADVGLLEFTEVVAGIVQNSSLRSSLRLRGIKRIAQGFNSNSAEEFVSLLTRELL